MTLNDLYYKCLDRIDENNIELAEEYLIGCITWLYRKENGRADRDRIAEDISLNRGLDKYEAELQIIANISDQSLATLIASSLDFSKELERITDIHDKIKISIYDEVQAHNQTAKIRKAITVLTELEKLINDNGRPNRSPGVSRDGN